MNVNLDFCIIPNVSRCSEKKRLREVVSLGVFDLRSDYLTLDLLLIELRNEVQ